MRSTFCSRCTTAAWPLFFLLRAPPAPFINKHWQMKKTRNRQASNNRAHDCSMQFDSTVSKVMKCDLGKGLFAARGIHKGTIVATMQPIPVFIGSDLYFKHHNGLPGGDAAVFVERKQTLYTSKHFGPFINNAYVRAPKWYRMNHSQWPNAKVMFENNTIVWKALRFIPARSAITWHYGQPDPSWRVSKHLERCTVPER